MIIPRRGRPAAVLLVLALAARAAAQDPAPPERLAPVNAFAKATLDLGEGSALALAAPHYRGAWHGSGEIPARAVRARLDTGGVVPLAPRVTARGDLTARLPWGLAASLGMRHLGDRYADEERRQTARGYTLFDVTARYRYSIVELFASVENLTNTEWREAQFFFTSRLPGEPAGGVPDVHFTPGNPRTMLGGVAIRF